MIVEGEIEGDAVVAQKRLDAAELERQFHHALHLDVGMVIAMAREAHKAYVKDLAKRQARDGLSSA